MQRSTTSSISTSCATSRRSPESFAGRRSSSCTPPWLPAPWASSSQPRKPIRAGSTWPPPAPGHLAGELLKSVAGFDVQHVPYRGEGPALTDMIGGQVQSMFSSAAPVIPLIRTGKLRAIAVTTATRLPSLPDVPSLSETIPGYEVSTWAGVGAPRGTPAEIVAKLNREINAGLASAAIQAKYADLGYTMFITSPAEFGSFIAEDTAKWAKVIRAANIK